LAEHTLTLLPKITEETEHVAGLALDRIDLINVTGNPKHIDELESYIGDQYGLPSYMRDRIGYHGDKLTIKEEALKAIKELSE
jgi:hypothetical protein